MTLILEDFAEELLIDSMITNNNGFIDLFKTFPGVESSQEGLAEWFLTGIPFPLFNGVIATDLKEEVADLKIGQVLGIFRDKDLPMIWSVTPLSKPQDLGKRLESHGLRHGGASPSMAVDLNTLLADIDLPDGVTIKTVGNDAELESWCDILTGVFHFPAFVKEALFNFMVILGYDLGAPVKNFIGLDRGRVVTVSTLLLAGGVAGIYNVGTLPQARRRGLGRAITLAPLLEARELGYRIGVLQSTRMGLGVYSKLGFKEYCTISRYLWTPENVPGI